MTTSDEQLSFDFVYLARPECSLEPERLMPSPVVSLEQVRQQRYRLHVLERVRQARIFDTSQIDSDLLEG